MPTGYTAKLYDGEINQTPLDYILSISNQFIPRYISVEDLKNTSKDDIVNLIKYNDTYDIYLQKELESEKEFLNMSDEEIQNIIDQTYSKRIREYRRIESNKIEIRKRYEDMLIKLQNWECGESCFNIKKFAIQQLLDSVEFDCQPYYPSDLYEKENVEEYKRTMKSTYKRNINRYKEMIEECKSTYENNLKFINEFVDSLELLNS